MWTALIREIAPEAVLLPPATRRALDGAAVVLGGPLPEPLVALLSETNGVRGEYGLGLVWPVETIAAENVAFRTNADFRDLYMPFDPLLFFADAGNGDQFAFLWTPRRDEVFVWDHETDSRTWVAPSLETYLRWWLDGRFTL